MMSIRRPVTGLRCLAVALTVVTATMATGVGMPDEPSAVAAESDPSGQPVPRGDLDGWRQIFVDDFSTNVPRGQFPSKVSSKWGAYKYGWKDSTKKGTYAPNKVVSVNDGVLTKHLRTENAKPLVAALLPKVPGSDEYGQLYGRYAVRMRADKTSGYKIAWLLWPDTGTTTTGAANGVGGNGEIDFPEADLRQDNPHVFGYVHRQNATRGSDQAWFKKNDHDITKWHTYVIEWSPGLVVLKLDGKELGRTTERIPNTPMHWVIQTETSFNHETLAATQGEVEIDWVAAWAYDPAVGAEFPPDELHPDEPDLPEPPEKNIEPPPYASARRTGIVHRV